MDEVAHSSSNKPTRVCRRPVERIDLFEDGRAFVLRNVLSPDECEGYIAAAQQLGMKSVQVDGYECRVRKCTRVAAMSEEIAGFLFTRIAPFLAPVDLSELSLGKRPKGIPADRARAKWLPHGLNEMFRICEYTSGGHFAPHLDGGYVRSRTDASMHTFMLYLNDSFEGGRTRFFDDSQAAYRKPNPNKVIHTYVPCRGDALVFHSELMHDGEALQSGHKWIMRSEVMFQLQTTAADQLLSRLFGALGSGHGCVVGMESTVEAVQEGRAATVLVSEGLRDATQGTWLMQQGIVDVVTVPALSGAGRQFLAGLEGIGALLYDDEQIDANADANADADADADADASTWSREKQP